MTRHALRIIAVVLTALLVVIVGIRFAIAKKFSTGGAPRDAIQKTATSKDGTAIAYEQTGSGPLLILVSAALTDRDGDRLLAKELAPSFTVLNYDRRGRGKSGNNEPYAVEREIDDLETLINTSAGRACISSVTLRVQFSPLTPPTGSARTWLRSSCMSRPSSWITVALRCPSLS
jgi:hypothetical protein